MYRLNILWILGSLCMLMACQDPGDTPEAPNTGPQPVAVSKSNSTKLYMHYMPWFNSKEFSGFWGYHWTLANRNPDYVTADGNQNIASHYYPLIGPYDSSDPDVIDYHLLLMKLSGIDGLLIDWYGTHDANDYRINFDHANALIARIARTGLEFAIVYEEFTAEQVAANSAMTDIEAAQADMRYVQSAYFNKENYIRYQENPLLLTFGPRYFNQASKWDDILGELSDTPAFAPLWFATNRVGSRNASGEFAWVDFTTNMDELNGFYNNFDDELMIGSAFPGFHDFYEEGGVGSSFGFVDHQNGQTLQKTLDLAAAKNVDHLQLVTWNDFGEGTMFEPTLEFGYTFLEQIQDFAGVSYDKEALELVHTYFQKRKEFPEDDAIQDSLDEAFKAFVALDLETASSILGTL